jgi:sigma-E factor negative regulatory protein RseB
MYWLDRVVVAAHKLNYSGTFIFQNGGVAETSRITHAVVAGQEAERIEVLDGSPREVVRANGEVRCYLPDSRTLIIEKALRQRSFPALLPATLGGLSDNYVIRKGSLGRVAGRVAQSIMLEPKDELRYGHLFWVDVDTGLLLKAVTTDERNEPLETFSFTQVDIGGPIEHTALKSKFAEQSSNWRVEDMYATKSRREDAAWQFKVQLPGFTKVAGMMRQPRPDAPKSIHIIYSDGLAAISVFIEPLPAHAPATDLGMVSMGVTSAYRRSVGDFMLVVMGEVPQAALKRFADGIELRRR